jgi:hypothetical protein
MNKNIVATDNPLTQVQQSTLSHVLEAIIPADESRGLPAANEMDLVTYLGKQAPEFIPVLIEALESFDHQFASLTAAQRYPIVEEFSKTSTNVFNLLLFHTFACYYQDDRVHERIGMAPGPPFPRGNDIVSGDLSLLDPVLKRPRLFR